MPYYINVPQHIANRTVPHRRLFADPVSPDRHAPPDYQRPETPAVTTRRFSSAKARKPPPPIRPERVKQDGGDEAHAR